MSKMGKYQKIGLSFIVKTLFILGVILLIVRALIDNVYVIIGIATVIVAGAILYFVLRKINERKPGDD